MGIYKYISDRDYYFYTNITGRRFKNEWLEIKPDGVMVVKKGYAWNGCSPKWLIADLFIGTPDGATDLRTYKPKTFLASMLHDVLYQFKDFVPITRKEADELFREQLNRVYFFWTDTYYFFVRVFGWIYGKWKIRKFVV